MLFIFALLPFISIIFFIVSKPRLIPHNKYHHKGKLYSRYYNNRPLVLYLRPPPVYYGPGDEDVYDYQYAD